MKLIIQLPERTLELTVEEAETVFEELRRVLARVPAQESFRPKASPDYPATWPPPTPLWPPWQTTPGPNNVYEPTPWWLKEYTR